MIRKAEIEDSTYRPYNEQAIQNQLNAQGVLGAKNLLNSMATTQTINGVTVTVDDNKVITLNGTSTADSYITLLSQTDLNNLLAKYGDLIINGSHPTEYNNARIITRYGSSNYIVDSGKGALLYASITYEMRLSLQIFSGRTFNNHKIYPMLRLASDPDDTYQPYAMTNRELTEKVLLKKALSNVDLNDITEYGIYSIQTGITNRPESVTYATLIVAPVSSFDGAARTQMVYKDQYLYIRSKSGSPATWTNWYKFTGTVVS